jgi:hypothetical protein
LRKERKKTEATQVQTTDLMPTPHNTQDTQPFSHSHLPTKHNNQDITGQEATQPIMEIVWLAEKI